MQKREKSNLLFMYITLVVKFFLKI